jgi:two-component system chemotaxis response regulator CheY
MHIIPQNKDCIVLIVDDSPFMINMLHTMLDVSGCIVIAEANDAEDAVAKYLKYRPTITFMDVLLPHKSGIDATKQILSIDENAKVVMCSSLGHEDLVNAALESGAREIMSKPYKVNRLQEVIQIIMHF